LKSIGMPSWLRFVLIAISAAVGFWVGGTLAYFVAMLTLWILRAAEIQGPTVSALVNFFLILGGDVLGLYLGLDFAIKRLPILCPQCGGRTCYRSGKPKTYRCAACAYVHSTTPRGA
jgi:hypothetical protein